jgi:hypothetical protein
LLLILASNACIHCPRLRWPPLLAPQQLKPFLLQAGQPTRHPIRHQL